MLEQISSGDPQRLTELTEADVLLIEKALLLAELTALEQLDHAESHSTSPEATVLRGACLDAFYLLRRYHGRATRSRAKRTAQVDLLRCAR